MKKNKNKTKKEEKILSIQERGGIYFRKMQELAISLDFSVSPIVFFPKPKSFYAKMAIFFLKKSKAKPDLQLNNINPKQ